MTDKVRCVGAIYDEIDDVEIMDLLFEDSFSSFYQGQGLTTQWESDRRVREAWNRAREKFSKDKE